MTAAPRNSVAKPGRLVAVCAVMVALHCWVAPEVRIFGVRPELLVGLPVAFGYLVGAEAGAVAGAAAGLLVDLLGGGTMGLAMLSYAAAGFVVGLASDDAATNVVVAALFGALGSIVAVLAHGIAGNVAGSLDVGAWRLVQVAIWVAVVNAALAPVLARILRPVIVGGRLA